MLVVSCCYIVVVSNYGQILYGTWSHHYWFDFIMTYIKDLKVYIIVSVSSRIWIKLTEENSVVYNYPQLCASVVVVTIKNSCKNMYSNTTGILALHTLQYKNTIQYTPLNHNPLLSVCLWSRLESKSTALISNINKDITHIHTSVASGVLEGIPTSGFFLTAYTHLSDHK